MNSNNKNAVMQWIMCSCLLVGSSVAGAVKLSPSTSFESTDGVNIPSLGMLVEGTGDGPGWLGPWVVKNISADTLYDNTYSVTGQWSLLQDTTGRDEEPEIERVFEQPMKKGHVSLRVRRDKTDRNTLGIFLSNGSPMPNSGVPTTPSRAIYLAFVPSDYFNATSGNGDVSAWDGTHEIVIADNFQAANTWYEVLIEFNCAQNSYDVYVDGQQLNTTALQFYAPQTELDRITIFTGANQSPGQLDTAGSRNWIDDIHIAKKIK